tara:strand:- start:1880 stop:2134 length:255 start_codon:yes stop_codon:yes gene_type:complete
MRNIIDRIMQDDLIKEISTSLSKEEMLEFESWMNEYILPLESSISSVKDLMSTEKTSEELADAINNLFTSEGVEEVRKCLQEKD